MSQNLTANTVNTAKKAKTVAQTPELSQKLQMQDLAHLEEIQIFDPTNNALNTNESLAVIQ